MKMRVSVATLCSVAMLASIALAGPKGTVQVLPAPGPISIDGDFSDWNLSRYTTVAEQPLFPEAQESLSTDAFGDHVVWDIDRVSGFNGSVADDWDP